MATTIQTRPARTATSPPRATPKLRGRRRPVPVIAGAILVVFLAGTFMWIQLRSDHNATVLVVNRPVSAGATITAADLRTARITPDPTIELVKASDADTVIGRTARIPLVAGTVLSAQQVGPAAFPASGQAAIAVPVAAGRLPAGLAPGARVQVVTVAATNGGAGQPAPVAVTAPVGMVIAITGDVDGAGTTVVSLLLPTDAALAVAGSAGDITLAVLPPTN